MEDYKNFVASVHEAILWNLIIIPLWVELLEAVGDFIRQGYLNYTP